MTALTEKDRSVVATSFRALACELRHRFLAEEETTSIIAVDGFSGSGKSYFARRLAFELGVTVINTDDFVPGWNGLGESIDLLEEWILEPLSRGESARWHRYDWDLMRTTEWVDVAPSPALVVEGCGVGAKRLSHYYSYLVWVEADESLRLGRLPQRFDWEMYQPFVDVWAEQERKLRTGDDVAARADLVIENREELERSGEDPSFLQRVSGL
jgi:cytidylate kinase